MALSAFSERSIEQDRRDPLRQDLAQPLQVEVVRPNGAYRHRRVQRESGWQTASWLAAQKPRRARAQWAPAADATAVVIEEWRGRIEVSQPFLHSQ